MSTDRPTLARLTIEHRARALVTAAFYGDVAAAKQAGVDRATVWRWRQQFETDAALRAAVLGMVDRAEREWSEGLAVNTKAAAGVLARAQLGAQPPCTSETGAGSIELGDISEALAVLMDAAWAYDLLRAAMAGAVRAGAIRRIPRLTRPLGDRWRSGARHLTHERS